MTANAKSEYAEDPEVRDKEANRPKPDLQPDTWTKDILYWVALLLLRRVSRRIWDLRTYKEMLKQCFANLVDSIPDWIGDEAGYFASGDDIAGEVLSRWELDVRFTKEGQPLPLPEEGDISLTTLIRSISESADVKEVITRLTSANSIELTNSLFRPTGREMELRRVPSPQLQLWHHVRLVWHTLKTVEGNARRQEEQRRFEFMSVGPMPIEAHLQLKNLIREPAFGFLETVDNIVVSSTDSAPTGKTVNVAVAVVQSDDLPLPPLLETGPATQRSATS